MRRLTLRRVALVLVALLVYAQATVAVAGCTMDRAEMAQSAAHGCCELPMAEPGPLLDSVCVTHCTADLQRFDPPKAIVRAPSPSPVLALPGGGAAPPNICIGAATPGAAVPLRILFQSFLT